MKKELHINPEEVILLKQRKHWFILLQAKAGTILLGAIPFVVAWLLLSSEILLTSVSAAALVYAGSLWLLIVWMTLATIWTNYYLDIWIVTDKRIIHVDQVGLFSREITTLRMERVQDVTTEVAGIISTMFNFGTLRVQSAGALSGDTIVHGLPDPEGVRRVMLEQVDKFTERHEQYTEKKDPEVCHDTHEE